MGRVIVEIKVENKEDLDRARRGELALDAVRSVSVADALVDTGAVMLSLPRRQIAALGLRQVRERKARTAAGLTMFRVYDVVRLTVHGREAPCEVVELPDECPALIGQIPLEALDFVVDPIGQRLIGNPEHGGEHMIDMFGYEFR